MDKTEDTKSQIENLRRAMGTLPSQSPELKTEFKRGVEGITVKLIDRPVNPYKSMVTLATTCWGEKVDKWPDLTPENRFKVLKAVLERQALPLALESSSYVFAIEGPSRAAFDQLARTRIGAVFSAAGMRDNNWKDASIRIPSSRWPSESEFSRGQMLATEDPSRYSEEDKAVLQKIVLFNSMVNSLLIAKRTYADIVDTGTASWQSARTVLPLYVCYRWSVAYNFSALLGVCGSRQSFCEMEDTCATAWLMREAIKKEFPLFASYLRPRCDNTHQCQYHKAYTMSEMFGCLFKECGRNPCSASDGYAEFNETCTDRNLLIEQLHIDIPTPQNWVKYDSFEDLEESDKALLRAD